jgi:hypothetical protein
MVKDEPVSIGDEAGRQAAATAPAGLTTMLRVADKGALLDSPRQYQDDDDDQDDPEPPASGIPPIGRVSPSRQGTDDEQNQHDQEDSSKHEVFLLGPVASGSDGFSPTHGERKTSDNGGNSGYEIYNGVVGMGSCHRRHSLVNRGIPRLIAEVQ